MRIKGAGQFGGQFGGQAILRSVFSLYVTTCDSRRCVQQSVQLRPPTLPRPTPLYCLRIFYWCHNSATVPNVYAAAPPDKPSLSTTLPLPLHPMPDAGSVVVHSSMFCFPHFSFPFCAAYHTSYAQLDSEFPLCQQSAQFF